VPLEETKKESISNSAGLQI